MDRPAAFYFDLASPEAYLSGERILSLMPAPVEWIGVSATELPDPPDTGAQLEEAARLVPERGLQALVPPSPFPFDSRTAMLAATYARQIGRAVPFALAAWRQAFAAGRPLDEDGIVIAGSACEMHPAALLKSTGTASVARALDEATTQARLRGVRSVPAVWIADAGGNGEGVAFHGDAGLEEAARALGETVPSP